MDVDAVPASLLTGLNTAQREATKCLEGPLLIVAGPGSGKTRVVTHRIAALLATQRATPEQILAVTFTNRAATEMRERVASLVGPEAQRMWVATFHSACVRLLRHDAALVNLPRSFAIVDTSEARAVLTKVIEDAYPGPLDKDQVKQAQHLISLAKNAGQSPEALALVSSDGWVAPLMREYNRRLQDMGAVDFDDILLHTLYLLERHPDVTAFWRARFRHLTVDEFQDTNAVQYRITRLLCEGADSVCVVGDPDQSIYGFRGATPDVMAAFREDEPTCRVVVLNENYRSTPAILRTVQSIIDVNPSPQRAHLTTTRAESVPVRLVTARSSRDEARFVVDEIRRALPRDRGPYAILFRTNAQTRAFEEELTKAAVRYRVVGALRFFDRAEVKDALSYLRVAVNPRDRVALARCLNTPRRGVGDVTASTILGADDPLGAIRASLDGDGPVPLTATTRESLASFLESLSRIAVAAAQSPGHALAAVLTTTGLREYVGKAKLGGPERQENLDELVRSAHDFSESFARRDPQLLSTVSDEELGPTLAYLENVALISANDTDTSSVDVILVSAHASKGQEFPHVYVTGVEEELFPHSRAKTPHDIEEERRLLFVAASRAKDSLTLTHCEERWMFGDTRAVVPSRFLRDLPGDVEHLDVTDLAPRPSAFVTRNAGTTYERRQSLLRPSTPSRPLHPHPTPPAVLGPRLKPEDLRVGARVAHKKFGEGVLVALHPLDHVATIDFAGDVKDLNLDFAPLTLVEAD